MIFKTRTRNRTGFYFLKEQDLELGFQFYFDVELEKTVTKSFQKYCFWKNKIKIKVSRTKG